MWLKFENNVVFQHFNTFFFAQWKHVFPFLILSHPFTSLPFCTSLLILCSFVLVGSFFVTHGILP